MHACGNIGGVAPHGPQMQFRTRQKGGALVMTIKRGRERE